MVPGSQAASAGFCCLPGSGAEASGSLPGADAKGEAGQGPGPCALAALCAGPRFRSVPTCLTAHADGWHGSSLKHIKTSTPSCGAWIRFAVWGKLPVGVPIGLRLMSRLTPGPLKFPRGRVRAGKLAPCESAVPGRACSLCWGSRVRFFSSSWVSGSEEAAVLVAAAARARNPHRWLPAEGVAGAGAGPTCLPAFPDERIEALT